MQPIEPAKPLNNAQIGGSFFLYTPMKQLFTKTFYSPQQHIVLLKNRGLLIADEEKAAGYIYNIGYFRLSAYFYPLLKFPKEQHQYKPGATFVQALNMYRFDRKLRLLLFNEIEKIEVAIRSCITNAVSEYFNDLFWITNPAYFFNMQSFRYTQDTIDAELKKSKEDFILHFRSAYTDDYPPAWMIAEILPLGLLCRIYTNLKDNVIKKRVAQHFGLQVPVFSSWIVILAGLRNMCCHHCRTWNRELATITTEPRRTKYGWIDSSRTDKRRMYYRICMIRYFLYTVSPNNNFKDKLKTLLAAYPNIDTAAMGFPSDWESEDIWK